MAEAIQTVRPAWSEQKELTELAFVGLVVVYTRVHSVADEALGRYLVL